MAESQGFVSLLVKNQLIAGQLVRGTGSYRNMGCLAFNLLYIGIALVIVTCDGMEKKTTSYLP